MADIKTHLRELSVATTIGLLKNNISFEISDLYNSRRFYNYAQQVIENDITQIKNILEVTNYEDELKQIIKNGYKLGLKIYSSKEFKISGDDKITWTGNDTQKGDPVDLRVGPYSFSLKEESFILKNMGLYNLLNNLTGSNYSRGLHVFTAFAPQEYDEWFIYTWQKFIQYIGKQKWELVKDGKKSSASIETDNIILEYIDEKCIVPVRIISTSEFIQHTTSVIREKVFSKWINNIFSNDEKYVHLKKKCSEKAGHAVSQKIINEFNPKNVYDFFQIYPFEYYYAKTTNTETSILKVPSRDNFTSIIDFVNCEYSVPSSQLNIVSTFKNIHTGKSIQFRNECRFSHGQFNGTPEAKMYVSRNSSLTDLYPPIY